ncbi:MAG: hypothetical protein WAZ98_03145 [Cyclobacteriaceae bacterium]
MKQLLLTNWNFIRLVRLGLGIWISVEGIRSSDVLLGFMGGFLLWLAVSNTGCCGTYTCPTPETKTNPPQTDDIYFEEVKPK